MLTGFARNIFMVSCAVVLFLARLKDLLIGSHFDLSPDSKSYISAAGHLLSGEGFYITSYFGQEVAKRAYLDWPPLYPVLIAALGLFGLDLVDAARLISTASLVAMIVPLYMILNKITKSAVFSAIGGILIMVSWPFLEISRHAWTETPFMFLSYVALFFMMDFNKEGKLLNREFILGTLFVLLSCLIRWTGLLLVFYGAALILFQRGIKRDHKTYRLLFFLFVTCLPLLLWCFRSVHITGDLGYIFGDKEFHASQYRHFVRNISLTLRTIYLDLFRIDTPFLAYCGLFLSLFLSLKNNFLYRCKVFIGYVILYFIFISGIVSLVALDEMGTRYTVSMYHSIMILIFVIFYDSVRSFFASNLRMKSAIFIFWLFFACLVYAQSLEMSRLVVSLFFSQMAIHTGR
ncbi:MAG: hypothetical protein PHR44_01885 [Candidatus Omnitrophica bacterium]|nr:hypothetical protein [Candidatus Omnitrophota bacterium]